MNNTSSNLFDFSRKFIRQKAPSVCILWAKVGCGYNVKTERLFWGFLKEDLFYFSSEIIFQNSLFQRRQLRLNCVKNITLKLFYQNMYKHNYILIKSVSCFTLMVTNHTNYFSISIQGRSQNKFKWIPCSVRAPKPVK